MTRSTNGDGRPVVEIRTTLCVEIRRNNRDYIDCGRSVFPLLLDASDKSLVCKLDRHAWVQHESLGVRGATPSHVAEQHRSHKEDLRCEPQ